MLVPQHAPSFASISAAPAGAPSFDRQQPFSAGVLQRFDLNGPGSRKRTMHMELSLAGSGIEYQPGDALGVIPRNAPDYLRGILGVLHVAAEAPVVVDGREQPMVEALTETFEVTTITRAFLAAYAAATRHPELATLLSRGQEERFRQYVYGREIIDVLVDYPPDALTAQSFVGMLRRLQPRLYSIASSLLVHREEAHLLVKLVRYESHGRTRRGVASGLLCERLDEEATLRVYPSPNPRFRLPDAADAPIIMVGPGTGVAPFRAFVEEREALGSRGRNWLFFGDQHLATDFLYRAEWQHWHRMGTLSRLDLAFSRDQPEKLYVQHRMLEQGRELFAWLEEGAHVYVCGEGARMGADVHEALLTIVGKEGGMGREAALAYLAQLLANRRYHRDLY